MHVFNFFILFYLFFLFLIKGTIKQLYHKMSYASSCLCRRLFCLVTLFNCFRSSWTSFGTEKSIGTGEVDLARFDISSGRWAGSIFADTEWLFDERVFFFKICLSKRRTKSFIGIRLLYLSQSILQLCTMWIQQIIISSDNDKYEQNITGRIFLFFHSLLWVVGGVVNLCLIVPFFQI